MFLLKKTIESFILPPGIMVLVLAGLAFQLRRRAPRTALFCAVLACGVWAGTSKAFSWALLRPLENAHSAPAKPQGDVIILLCGGFRSAGRPYSASERLAAGTLERAAAAFKLQKETGLPVLISGGAPFSEEPEAEAAAAWLRELGMPPARIITEDDSRDTAENTAYSLKICAEKGFRKPIILTSAYHMPRAVKLFRRAGAEVTPFPVAMRSGGPRFFVNYLPGGGITEARLALNEYLGLLFYFFF